MIKHLRTRVLTAALLPAFLFAGCSGYEPTAALSPSAAPLFAVDGAPGRVTISQVYGGGGNSGATLTHDFIELHNAGGTAVPLSGWSVQYASSAGTTWQRTSLTGSIAPGSYYLVQEAAGNAGTVPLPTPDATGNIPMSATSGKVALVNIATALSGACPTANVVDFLGYGAAATCSEGGPLTPNLSNTTAALRNGAGATDTDNNATDFTIGVPNPRNSTLGPSVASTVPTSGASNVAVDANVDITFTKPVTVSGSWFSISCAGSGAHTATVSGGPTTFTLDPDADFAGNESCTATVIASQVADLSATPIQMAADKVWSFTTGNSCGLSYTGAHAIQGSGMTTARAGETVTTQGVVIGDYEGPSPTLRGFYLQDQTGDGNPETSDGIFVFNGNKDDVKLGDVVRVTGRAEEFQDQTQLSNASVTVCGSGASVPPVDVTLPFPSATHLERYEGMLVRLPQTLYVTEHFQVGRFGQVVMSSGGRLIQPTSIAAPGGPAAAIQAQNDLNRIIVDDARNDQNADPILFGRGGNALSASNTLRGGDAATGIVGVLTYTWAGNAASGNAYRVRPVNALSGGVPNFVPANPRPAAPDPVGGSLKVAALNVLNYFNTFSGCTNGVGGAPTDCRGADNVIEFDRQWPKTVAAIVAMNADVVGVIEVENDGYGPQSAIADLVSKLNAATAQGTYAFIDADAATGQVNALGTDAIKVGLIYKPASVTPVGVTAVLNSDAFVNGGDAEPRNRPALAQAFIQPNRARFVVSVNHLKSKGSGCTAPDANDGQGECNLVRTNAARLLASWLESDPTDTGERDVLIVGDLNAYAKEDPVTALASGGYANLIAARLGPDAYSFAFDGQWGYLDHALGSAGLASQVAGVAEWHINADEPSVLDYNTNFKSAGQIGSLYSPDQYRVADHDPVIVGLTLRAPPVTYTFGGFLSPVDNLPAVNDVNSGRAIPLKFSLGGNRGLNIFAPGYPATRPISCGSGAVQAGLETETPGNSRLKYDAGTGTYHYNWKTDKAWANSCRELVVRFNDESQQTAKFYFSK